jgi:hypothetical protein
LAHVGDAAERFGSYHELIAEQRFRFKEAHAAGRMTLRAAPVPTPVPGASRTGP